MERKSILKHKLFVLEEDFYPENWKDDARMGVLLAEFRPRSVNPENYDSKMKFWKEMIQRYCDYKGCSAISLNELKEVFRRDGTSPYCLQDVFDNLQMENDLEEKHSYMEVPEKSWVGWGVNSLVKKPLKWGFGMIKEKVWTTSNKDETVFVVKSSVRRQATMIQSIVKKCHSYNNIISMEDLISSLTDTGLTPEGITLALHHLSCTEKVYIEQNDQSQEEKHHHNKALLKFAEPHLTVTPITQMQRSIFNLEHTEKFLITVLDEKEMAINELLTKIKECLKDGKKQVAKTYLRKKHLMEKDLEKTSQILENIQAMLQRVHGAKSDKDIISTYKMGSKAIKSAFEAAGLNLENVDDIIEDMREVLEEQQDIQNVISEPVRGVNDIDDSELEKELQDLIFHDNKNNNDNNDSFNKNKKDQKKEDDKFDDDEIERRLQRLRTDFHEPETSTTATIGLPKILPTN